MLIFILSILCGGEVVQAVHPNEVTQLIDHYIRWTQSGEADAGSLVFADHVELTYQTENGTFDTTSFEEYRQLLERAATSVPRSMNVLHVNVTGKRAKACVHDQSGEGDFSLVHHLELRRENHKWKMYAIQISHYEGASGCRTHRPD